MAPAIFSIPAELPFLDALVAGITTQAGSDPLALTRYTILLPTRRAARSLREAFLRASEGRALLLPRMLPVGDLDAEELAFTGDEAENGADGFDLPPALSPLRRQLMLARLVLAWGKARGSGPLTPGQAAPLARELGRFLDEVETAKGDFAALEALAPERFSEHWQQVLTFLKIISQQWPAILAESGALDPAERRNKLLEARATAWRSMPPSDPVIAAGLSGGIEAVTQLIEAVVELPQGQIVLPGLDFVSDGKEAILADATHPQHLLARLLDRLKTSPEEVQPWSDVRLSSAKTARRKLVRAALSPAAESDRWRALKGIDESAIASLRQLDCPGPQEEATLIALLMRECLQESGKTAALITPDRALARRVTAELRRWDIDIDDSAGVPLNRTAPGVFLRLLLELGAEDLAPLPLLAVLKHPLAACGQAPEIFRGRVRRLEKAALRGPRPAPGIEGLRRAIPSDDVDLQELVTELGAILAPLLEVISARDIPLASLVSAHIQAAEHLAATDQQSGADMLWRAEAGEAGAQFLAELREASAELPALSGAQYPGLFDALLAGPVVRPRYGRHPRLAIWGLLEARLQQADLMILGGLNEGVWPPQVESDPFLSRPMRSAFGLPSPEQRIGVAAHDFAQALGAREVVLTRAARVEGTPSVPSRWLLRLETVLRAVGLEGRITGASAPLGWVGLLDEPGARKFIVQPAPTPPVAARPRQLSVTQVETLIRDPYAVYARTILRLKPLEAIDAAPDAADRGTFIHQALDEFLREFPGALPVNAVDRLLALGERIFAPVLERPEMRAFWWPRFERIAHWFVETEAARRNAIEGTRTEVKGRLALRGPAGPFLLTAKADRVDRLRGGGIAIIDYKTGGIPTKREAELGYAPQLPLEAVIAEAGGFDGIKAAPVIDLEYWRLGGGDPAGEIKPLGSDAAGRRQLIEDALPGLKLLIAAYDDPRTSYRAFPRPEWSPRYSDYVHLARLKEWSVASGSDE